MALRGKQGLLAITNNINVVNILQGYEQIEVIVAGGVVRHSDGGVVGEAAVDFIRQFKVDYAVIGTSAIDEDGTLLDFDYREVKVAQAIIELRPQIHPGRRQHEVRAHRAGAHRPHLAARLFRHRRAAAAAAARHLPRQRCAGRDRDRALDISKKCDNLRFG